MITIVIPIIKFNSFSLSELTNLAKIKYKFDHLNFLFAVSTESVAKDVYTLLEKSVQNYHVMIAHSSSSNYLRSFARFAKTDFVFFHDCDDSADYYLLDEYSTKDLTDDIYCFNVQKKVFDVSLKNVIKAYNLFSLDEGVIKDIKCLPTCIYGKIIPKKILSKVDFPNLPYSQDWAISYQLYFLCKHLYVNRVLYYYNNYPSSSSSKNKSTLFGTNRVNVYGHNLIRKIRNLGYSYEADFLAHRYAILLNERYRQIGHNYFENHISLQLLFHDFKFHYFCSFIYRYIQSIYKYIEFFFQKK